MNDIQIQNEGSSKFIFSARKVEYAETLSIEGLKRQIPNRDKCQSLQRSQHFRFLIAVLLIHLFGNGVFGSEEFGTQIENMIRKHKNEILRISVAGEFYSTRLKANRVISFHSNNFDAINSVRAWLSKVPARPSGLRYHGKVPPIGAEFLIKISIKFMKNASLDIMFADDIEAIIDRDYDYSIKKRLEFDSLAEICDSFTKKSDSANK
jgi:hypothetical protein